MANNTTWFRSRFEENPRKICVECAECHKPMWLPKSRAAKYKFCGDACRDVRRKRRMAGWRAIQFIPAENKVATPCLECGTVMWLPPSKVGEYLRCSQACRKIWRDRQSLIPDIGWHAARFTSDPRKEAIQCKECARPMWLPKSKVGEYKRCSPECNLLWRTRLKTQRSCLWCNRLFTPRNRLIQIGWGQFCSHKCSGASRQVPGREGSRAKALRWRQNNPEKNKQQCARRRSLELEKLPYEAIRRIGQWQKWRCAICRVDIKQSYHRDHITPLSRGGRHHTSNIQLLCAPCNGNKSAKDPIVYMRSLGRLL